MSYNHTVMYQRSRDSQISDDLVSSQSIEGRDFHDFDMLDAKIASALKKIISNPHFRRRVCVEEQRAQKQKRFLQGRQIACMVVEHFRATGAYDAAQTYQVFPIFAFSEMAFKISAQDWTKLY